MPAPRSPTWPRSASSGSVRRGGRLVGRGVLAGMRRDPELRDRPVPAAPGRPRGDPAASGSGASPTRAGGRADPDRRDDDRRHHARGTPRRPRAAGDRRLGRRLLRTGLIERLGLGGQGGVLRIGLTHYNTRAEIDRLIEALAGSPAPDRLRSRARARPARPAAFRPRRGGYPAGDGDDRPRALGLRRAEHDRAAARGAAQGGRGRRSGGPSTIPRTGSCHPCDLEVARREHAAFAELLASLGADGARPRRRDRQPGPRLHVRSAARHRPRRDPAPARQAEPARRAGGHRGLDTAHGIPTVGRIEAPGHDRGRRHVLAAAGPVLHRPDAAHEPRGGPASSRARRRRRPRCSTCRTGKGRPSWSTCCRSSARSPTTSRSCSCRSCRSGCGSSSRDLGIRLDRGRPRTSSRPSAATCWPSGPGVVIVAEGNPGRPPPWPPPAARSTRTPRPRSG